MPQVDFILTISGKSHAFLNVPINPAVFKSIKPTQSLRTISEQFIEFVSGGFTPGNMYNHHVNIAKENAKSW